ncbi:Uncharacterized protein SCF082_LOCUS20637 [Durusdinium trenchii]|uniref:Uncharacterized protein n=1 Tax=Durusdinium trenchii TaxID=1381693 RepID=A0ABP0L3P8_9DINO
MASLTDGELHPELLRGVTMDICLSGWARHFTKPDSGILQNSQESYNLSRQTDSFDEFLSHDWDTPRMHKLLSMLMIYNSRAAFFCSLIFSLSVGILRSLQVLPNELWSELVSYAIFPLVLCFWQRIRRLFQRPLMVFFDMLCIAQHDEELKKKAISGIVNFLDASRQLTIFWSHRYFRRLWCTYEVSTFLRDPKKQKTILVMPVKLAVILFLFCMAEHMVTFGQSFWSKAMEKELQTVSLQIDDIELLGAEIENSQAYAHLMKLALFLPFLAFNPVLYYIGLGLMSDLQKMPSQLQDFRVQDAQCACCASGHRHPVTGEALGCDREAIFQMLKKWYGQEGDVGESHLESFNRRVHEVLAPRVLQSVGSDVLPFSYCLYMISVSKVPQLCSLIPHLAAGPANDLAARAHFASADLSEAARWAQAAWALRHVMTWAMDGVAALFWVRLSMRLWRWAVDLGLVGKSKARKLVSAFLLSLPLGVFLCTMVISYHGVLLSTDVDSLYCAIPFAFWIFVLGSIWRPWHRLCFSRSTKTYETCPA